MSAILDMITGGAVLPYVYCKKVTLDNSTTGPGLVDVTLQMELYQDKNTLSNSTWLNGLVTQGMNLMDAMFMQVLVYEETENVYRMLPSTNPTVPGGNVYTGKQFFGDGYLPRGEIEQGSLLYGSTSGGGKIFQSYNTPPPPIQISNSSLLGNLSGKDVLLQKVAEGKVREEIKNGKPYYVIPFEWKYTGFDPQGYDGNLGFVFYTFLNITYFLQTVDVGGQDIDFSLYSQFFEEFMIEGPVNAEVVFLNGKANLTRDVFIQPNGLVWEGSAHLHTADNPAPDGYQGNGGYGDNTGWMMGEQHISGVDQSRLSLMKAPNNLISDFRHSLKDVPLDTALGLGQETKVFNLGQPVTDILETFLSPFQKEKRKELIKDNDSEISKLYVSRDKSNNARGMFFINVEHLLKNNSSLYPILSSTAAFHAGDTYKILEKSKILELKLYRDRVKKRVINTRYEKYANDEIYEEPSELIATISDLEGYQTPSQNMHFAEITGIRVNNLYDFSRYFMFTDTSVGNEQAGLYQYRIELEFKDGTYEFLYELYQDLARNKVLLDAYYDLSQLSYIDTQISANNSHALANDTLTGENSSAYFKNVTRNYFNGQRFEHPQFFNKALETFNATNTGEALPWSSIPILLNKVQKLFGIWPESDGTMVDFLSPTISNLIDPQSGSPKGINFFSRVLDTVITKIQHILDATKVNKSGSEIDQKSVPNGYTFNNIFDVVVSPSDCIIHEEHTFDHPAELFKALSNEDIYVDYLSIGTPRSSDFQGLRSLSPEYYIDRCKLDSIKLSPHARTEWDNIDTFGSPGLSPDSFSYTGYSYLTPSIVELSDPTKEDRAYRFYYTAFNDAARSHVTSEQAPLYSEYFNNSKNYSRLLVSFLNYSLNKENVDDADLAGFIPHQMPSNKGALFGGLALREPYKKLFDNISITVHDNNLYNKFFNRMPGAVSEDEPDKEEYNNGLGLDWSDFSDGSLLIYPYLQNFLLNNKQTLLPSPICWPSPYEYNINLPNSFKFHHVRKNKLASALGGEDIAQPFLKEPLNSLPNLSSADGIQQKNIGGFAAFFFFQTTLTARIQVFLGSHPLAAKNDDDSWREFKASDLQLSPEEKLFCRIMLYDESLLKGVTPPILDKYFLIYPGGDNPFVPSVIPQEPNVVMQGETPPEPVNVIMQSPRLERDYAHHRRTEGPRTTGTDSKFWESQHLAELREFNNRTMEGRMNSKRKNVTAPFPPQPDPDPTDMPETSVTKHQDTSPDRVSAPPSAPANGGGDREEDRPNDDVQLGGLNIPGGSAPGTTGY